jgi:hypothetical protein
MPVHESGSATEVEPDHKQRKDLVSARQRWRWVDASAKKYDSAGLVALPHRQLLPDQRHHVFFGRGLGGGSTSPLIRTRPVLVIECGGADQARSHLAVMSECSIDRSLQYRQQCDNKRPDIANEVSRQTRHITLAKYYPSSVWQSITVSLLSSI